MSLYAYGAIAIVVSLFLAGTHLKAYKKGEAATQLEWDADSAQRTAAALAAEQAARTKERELQANVRKVADDYAKEKTRRVAADAAATDSLRRLTEALKPRSGASSAAASSGPDGDPRDGIVAECAGTLRQVDRVARGLAAQVTGLQAYAKNCQ